MACGGTLAMEGADPVTGLVLDSWGASAQLGGSLGGYRDAIDLQNPWQVDPLAHPLEAESASGASRFLSQTYFVGRPAMRAPMGIPLAKSLYFV
jgi:hypothetical protein